MATKSSRLHAGEKLSSHFNCNDAPFCAHLLRVLIILYTLFAICGQKNNFCMDSYNWCWPRRSAAEGGVIHERSVLEIFTTEESNQRSRCMSLGRQVRFCQLCTSHLQCIHFGLLIYRRGRFCHAAKILQWYVLLPSLKSDCPKRLGLTPIDGFHCPSWMRRWCLCQAIRLVCRPKRARCLHQLSLYDIGYWKLDGYCAHDVSHQIRFWKGKSTKVSSGRWRKQDSSCIFMNCNLFELSSVFLKDKAVTSAQARLSQETRALLCQEPTRLYLEI